MSEKVYRLTDREVMEITQDARLVAIRWDVLPWSIVLDIDTPASEQDHAEMRRTWICFSGIDSFTWNFENTRLPTGCWLNSTIGVTPLSNEFTEYCFSALTAQFCEDGSLKGNSSTDVIIQSRRIAGVSSIESAYPEQYGLSWDQRTALASDEDFISILGND